MRFSPDTQTTFETIYQTYLALASGSEAKPITCVPRARPISTPISWYGGKIRMAETIVALLPPHKTYVEPFGGGLAVLFAKPKSEIEIVSDINHSVANFFRVLREQPAELQRRLKLTPYSRHEHQLCCDPKPTRNEIEDARRFFVRVRQSFSGIEKGTWSLGLDKARANDSANIVDRLEKAAQRLRKVQIESRGFKELLPAVKNRADKPNTVIYADPTYLPQCRVHPKTYRHEMSISDHNDLLDLLISFKSAKVIISGYRTALYDSRLKGWNRKEIVMSKATSTSTGKTKTYCTEVLWMNW